MNNRRLALMTLVVSTFSWTPLLAQEVGLQLYSLREQLAEDLPAALAQISAWGIRAVEGGGTLYEHPLDDFRAALKRNGLSIVSVDTSYEELRDNPIAAVYKARYYGAVFATFY